MCLLSLLQFNQVRTRFTSQTPLFSSYVVDCHVVGGMTIIMCYIGKHVFCYDSETSVPFCSDYLLLFDKIAVYFPVELKVTQSDIARRLNLDQLFEDIEYKPETIQHFMDILLYKFAY